MLVPYLTEIFDPFLSLHSTEEHHSDHFSFGYLGGEKITRKSPPRKKGCRICLYISYWGSAKIHCPSKGRWLPTTVTMSFAQKRETAFSVFPVFSHVSLLISPVPVAIVSGMFCFSCWLLIASVLLCLSYI